MTATKVRFVRIDEALWSQARLRAKCQDTNVSALIRQWLTEYTKDSLPVGNGDEL